jgi:hypothetical protein
MEPPPNAPRHAVARAEAVIVGKRNQHLYLTCIVLEEALLALVGIVAIARMSPEIPLYSIQTIFATLD